jgi:hypothetical protein
MEVRAWIAQQDMQEEEPPAAVAVPQVVSTMALPPVLPVHFAPQVSLATSSMLWGVLASALMAPARQQPAKWTIRIATPARLACFHSTEAAV